MDLYSSLINTLCTAALGFSRDYASAASISDELYSPIMCNGNSMHAVRKESIKVRSMFEHLCVCVCLQECVLRC